jgi:hypothetical protein
MNDSSPMPNARLREVSRVRFNLPSARQDTTAAHLAMDFEEWSLQNRILKLESECEFLASIAARASVLTHRNCFSESISQLQAQLIQAEDRLAAFRSKREQSNSNLARDVRNDELDKHSILVRKGHPSDAKAIRDIALSRRVTSQSGARSGLIDYPVPTEMEYHRKIQKGSFFVAESSETNEVLGFLDIYLDSVACQLFEGDPVLNRIAHQENDCFMFLNTIAVKHQAEGIGVTSALKRMAFRDVPSECKAIWTCIVHKPLKNITSSTLAKRWGFVCVEEFDAFSVTFGLYCMKI